MLMSKARGLTGCKVAKITDQNVGNGSEIPPSIRVEKTEE